VSPVVQSKRANVQEVVQVLFYVLDRGVLDFNCIYSWGCRHWWKLHCKWDL